MQLCRARIGQSHLALLPDDYSDNVLRNGDGLTQSALCSRAEETQQMSDLDDFLKQSSDELEAERQALADRQKHEAHVLLILQTKVLPEWNNLKEITAQLVNGKEYDNSKFAAQGDLESRAFNVVFKAIFGFFDVCLSLNHDAVICSFSAHTSRHHAAQIF